MRLKRQKALNSLDVQRFKDNYDTFRVAIGRVASSSAAAIRMDKSIRRRSYPDTAALQLLANDNIDLTGTLDVFINRIVVLPQFIYCFVFRCVNRTVAAAAANHVAEGVVASIKFVQLWNFNVVDIIL